MMRDVVGGRYRMSWLTTVIVIFCVAYIIDPFDLIPDFIPVIGWIDDGAVLYLLLWRLVNETHRYNRYKAMGRKSQE
jgi:uncharacterized membrane protein YkvA (DUF1232 family)